MSKLRKVSIEDFEILLSYAQKVHAKKDEPIPMMNQEQREKIKVALHTPFDSFAGIQFYRGFISKAAALFYYLAKDHYLGNGNKRMAILTLAYFYDINDRKLKITDEEIYELATTTAKSDSNNSEDIKRYIKKILSK